MVVLWGRTSRAEDELWVAGWFGGREVVGGEVLPGAEMPELQGLADDLHGQPFVLFTIDLQEDAETIGPFRRELGLRLPVLLDEDGDVTRSYGVRALPATFLIDRDGILRH